MSRPRAVAGLAAGVLALSACSAGASLGPASAGTSARATPPGGPAGHGTGGSPTDPPPPAEPVGGFGPPVRATVATGCPRLTRLVADVVPEGPPVRTALVPAGAPTAGLECRYQTGRVDGRLLVGSRRLDARAAGRLAARLRTMSPGRSDRRYTCLAIGLPPGGTLVVLAYPGRPDVDVWLPSGCPSRGTNGWVQAYAEPI